VVVSLIEGEQAHPRPSNRWPGSRASGLPIAFSIFLHHGSAADTTGVRLLHTVVKRSIPQTVTSRGRLLSAVWPRFDSWNDSQRPTIHRPHRRRPANDGPDLSWPSCQSRGVPLTSTFGSNRWSMLQPVDLRWVVWRVRMIQHCLERQVNGNKPAWSLLPPKKGGPSDGKLSNHYQTRPHAQ
jgi:hypothetical protein